MKKLSLLLVAAGVLLAAPVQAGVVRVHDNVGLLSEDEMKELEAEGKYNFELHVLIKNAGQSLGNDTQKAVTAPNVLAIGLDPINRKTSVRYGDQVSVQGGVNLATQGDQYFKNRNWLGGIRAIADQAQVVSVATRVVEVEQTSPQAEAETFKQPESHTFLWFMLVMLVVGLVVYLIIRASSRSRTGYGTSQGYTPSYDPPAPSRTPKPRSNATAGYEPVPGPTTVVVQQPDSGLLNTVVGYELGRMSGEASARRNDPAPTPVVDPPPRIITPKAPSNDSSWGSSKKSDDSDWSSSSSKRSSSDSSYGSSRSSSSDSSWGSSYSGGSDSSWGGGGDSGGGGGDSSW